MGGEKDLGAELGTHTSMKMGQVQVVGLVTIVQVRAASVVETVTDVGYTTAEDV